LELAASTTNSLFMRLFFVIYARFFCAVLRINLNFFLGFCLVAARSAKLYVWGCSDGYPQIYAHSISERGCFTHEDFNGPEIRDEKLVLQHIFGEREFLKWLGFHFERLKIPIIQSPSSCRNKQPTHLSSLF